MTDKPDVEKWIMEARTEWNMATGPAVADDWRVAMRAFLRAAASDGYRLVRVPDERRMLSGDGEFVDAANAGAHGHNALRDTLLASAVEVGE